MLLNIDKQPRESLAAKDSSGNIPTYGDIVDHSKLISESVLSRSLVFLLTENNVGGIAWIISSIVSGVVPLIFYYTQY